MNNFSAVIGKIPSSTAIQKEGVAEVGKLYLDRLMREHGDHLEASGFTHGLMPELLSQWPTQVSR